MSFGKSTFLKQTTLDFRIGKVLITINNDTSYLHLFFFIYINIKYDMIVISNIITLTNFYIYILITFIFKIVFCKLLGAIYHIWSNLTAFKQS